MMVVVLTNTHTHTDTNTDTICIVVRTHAKYFIQHFRQKNFFRASNYFYTTQETYRDF